ncbi:MAG: COG2426 family protein [Faecousia sp.]
MLIKYVAVFFVSMVPLIELRGAIPIAIHMDLPTLPAIAVCVVGNMIPVPVIYFFARKFLLWGLDKRFIGGICRFFHDKGEKAGRKLSSGRYGRYGLLVALMLFVGIPIPGTGAWTGTLGASFLDMGAKSTAVAVSLGLVIAGIIMTVVSLLGFHIFGL